MAPTVCFTYDEGVNTFKLVIEENIVKVYKTIPDSDTCSTLQCDEEKDFMEVLEEFNENYVPYAESYPTKPDFVFEAIRIFINGQILTRVDSDVLNWTEEDEMRLSLLLEVNREENVYIWIGDSVIKFKTLAPIAKFNSKIDYYDCNAVDEDGNYYLMYAHAIMLFNESLNQDISKYDGEHQYYYRNCMITNIHPHYHNEGFNPKGIQAFYVNGHITNLELTTDPEKHFRDLVTAREIASCLRDPDVPQSGASIKDKDGNIVSISMQEYLDMVTELAKVRGFLPLNPETLSQRFCY
jgi:hypothetical protein